MAALDGAQGSNLGLNEGPVEHAARLGELIGDASGQALDLAALDRGFEIAQGAKPSPRLRRQEGLQPPRGPLSRWSGTKLTKQAHTRSKEA